MASFLCLLPLEIRDHIYGYVLGSGTIHLALTRVRHYNAAFADRPFIITNCLLLLPNRPVEA